MALPLDKLNKLLRTAALGVEVVQTKSKGRGIIATRAHRAGAAVVPAGEPLAHSSKRAVNAFAGHGEFAGSKQRINQLHAIDACTRRTGRFVYRLRARLAQGAY